MQTLEQLAEEMTLESNGLSDDPVVFLDNPFLNFRNYEVYFEKQKECVREKVKQSASALEHYQSLVRELKIKKSEIQQQVIFDCLKAIGFPKEIKWVHQSLRIQLVPGAPDSAGLRLRPAAGRPPPPLPPHFPRLPRASDLTSSTRPRRFGKQSPRKRP
jgi:hypothetical protein